MKFERRRKEKKRLRKNITVKEIKEGKRTK